MSLLQNPPVSTLSSFQWFTSEDQFFSQGSLGSVWRHLVIRTNRGATEAKETAKFLNAHATSGALTWFKMPSRVAVEKTYFILPHGTPVPSVFCIITIVYEILWQALCFGCDLIPCLCYLYAGMYAAPSARMPSHFLLCGSIFLIFETQVAPHSQHYGQSHRCLSSILTHFIYLSSITFYLFKSIAQTF